MPSCLSQTWDVLCGSMGRPPTRRRPDAEIAALAARLGQDWTPGDLVLTWLRRHVAELTAMVQDGGWSWSDVARALDAAGITYRTGRPWTARLLTTKAEQARRAVRLAASTRDPADAMIRALKEALGGLGGVQQLVVNMPGVVVPSFSREPDVSGPARASVPASLRPSGVGPGTSPVLPRPQAGDTDAPSPRGTALEAGEDDGPRFELVSFADGWVPPSPQPEPLSETKPPPKPKRRFDPDEVLRRLDGVSAPTSNEDKD